MASAFDVSGLTAVVTGGGRGLGLGITSALLDAGVDVHVISRRPPLDEVIDQAAEAGRRLIHHEADLGDREVLDRLADEILAEDRIDILINNAGTQERHPAVEFPLDSFDRVIDINLRSVFQACQLFGAPMLERGRGKIINIASMLSFQGGLNVPAYAASKGGVAQLTKALCNEWAPRGVNVNAIAPGYMDTEMNTALIADPVRSEQIMVRIPAGRWGNGDDIGNVAVFLASAASDYIHGQIIPVDGGWLAR
ncbi:SDR family oxidoreductase [Propionimicrobium sp. PCR01-08-3]|uniref:SDR family oxidoreductase n=1 Tax=Propionimicrobium sp. PCR01-08-3 TaxID=3052086 RepID=UPI00255C3D25|nr:SDR family oxidoreductase [Propionimicrobium sp. PCR01-08-3]WIY82544.1 SDR family oxidoreductase [Propionimicrobium sp. PCR01-08-3]